MITTTLMNLRGIMTRRRIPMRKCTITATARPAAEGGTGGMAITTP